MYASESGKCHGTTDVFVKNGRMRGRCAPGVAEVSEVRGRLPKAQKLDVAQHAMVEWICEWGAKSEREEAASKAANSSSAHRVL